MSTAFFQFRQILQKFPSNCVQLSKPRSGGREKFVAGFALISVKLVLDIRTQLRYNLNKRISNPVRGLAANLLLASNLHFGARFPDREISTNFAQI